MNTQLQIDRLSDDELGHWEESGFGSLQTGSGVLPLKAMDIQGKIAGLLAHVALEQTFVNTHGQPLEATYIFPLPAQAAVTSFRMEVDGRIVVGELKERGEAREAYDTAIASGQRAAIAEEDRSDVFSMRVGNILPDEHARIRLTLTYPLQCRDNEVTFRFPLVVAPRYIPGVPLEGPQAGEGTAVDTDAVPDASRISPPVLLKGYPNPVRLGLSLEIAAGEVPIEGLRSSLHTVLLSQDQGRYTLALQPEERLNRDFLLRYWIGDDQTQPALWLAPDRSHRPHWEQRESGVEPPVEGDQGTFLLSLTPPRIKDKRKPRDIAFLLDRSGSMSGWKMVAANRAVERMLAGLDDDDRFNVFAFDHQMDVPPGFRQNSLHLALPKRRLEAIEYLDKLGARGGTDMAEPLLHASELLATGSRQEDREQVLVLVTDGQVGNEDQLLRGVKRHSEAMRIFTLGIDSAVNAGFLERLATLGGGVCELVESQSRLEEAFQRIQRLIETPVLAELELSLEGITLLDGSLCPGRLPDLFAGVPVNIMGRYQGRHEGSVEIKARDAGGKLWSHRISGQIASNPSIPTIWARQQIRKLEDQIATGAGRSWELEPQILKTSLDFGVLSRFTAFVAVDEEKVVKPKDPELKQVVQGVESPAGWEFEELEEPEEPEIANQAPALEVEPKPKLRKKSKGSRENRPSDKDPVRLYLAKKKAPKKPGISKLQDKKEAPAERMAREEARRDAPAEASAPADAKSNLAEHTRQALATLTPREEETLRMRFGSGSKADIATGEAAEAAGQRRKQIEEKALRKLRSAGRPSLRPSGMGGRGAAPMGSSSSANQGGGGGFGAAAPPRLQGLASPPMDSFDAMPADPLYGGVADSPARTFTQRPRPPRRSDPPMNRTEAGVLKGQYQYLAPEQVQGKEPLPSSDLFTLGVILYLLLTGREPFKAESALVTLQKILVDEPTFDAVEEYWVPLLKKLLAKAPSERYTSAQEFLADLQKLQAPAASFGGLPQKLQDAAEQARQAHARGEISGEVYTALEALATTDNASQWLACRPDDEGALRFFLLEVLRPDLAADPEWASSFLEEARLEHPHIAPLVEVGVHQQSQPYRLFGFGPAISLQQLLRMDPALTCSMAYDVAHAVASALGHIHEHPSVPGTHGSLAPEKIFVDHQGALWISHFGPAPQPFQAPMGSADVVFPGK